MADARRACLGIVLLAITAGTPRSAAQTPGGAEFRVNEVVAFTQDSAQLAMAADGSYAVLWHTGRLVCPKPRPPGGPCSDDFQGFTVARFYSSRDSALTGEMEMSQAPAAPIFALPGPDSTFRFSWADADYATAGYDAVDYLPLGAGVSQRFTFGPLAATDRVTVTGAAPDCEARFVLAWITDHNTATADGRDVRLTRFDSTGNLIGETLTLDADPDLRRGSADVGTDGAGRAVAAWVGDCSEEVFDCDIFAQLLSSTNERLGPPIRVNSNLDRAQYHPAVSVAPGGSFLVAWETEEVSAASNPFAVDVAAQAFSPSGEKLGPEIPVGDVPDFSDFLPATAVDPSGNYLVAWSTFRLEGGVYGFDIVGQLVRSDGRKVGGVFRISEKQTGNEFPQPKIAFAQNGTFVAVWNADDGDFDGVFARRFFASPAAEPCMFRGGRFRCDGARTGGEAELEIFFSRRSGSEPLLGDMDGDGRDDPCVRRYENLRCDLDHGGEPAEYHVRFGEPGEKLLLGDVDGDGRDDACLRRANGFFCDTRHDGGSAETIFHFGLASDLALLGDVDGDGRAEPCVWRGGRFRCDTKHDGGAAEWIDVFGQPGDQLLLSDLDGDGRDEPCTFRAGLFLCDTAGDGGSADMVLHFGDDDEVPLSGNVDGL